MDEINLQKDMYLDKGKHLREIPIGHLPKFHPQSRNIVSLAGVHGRRVWIAKTVTFNATDASLTEFNLNNNNTLHYNLTSRNPNNRIGRSRRGQRFSTVQLRRFRFSENRIQTRIGELHFQHSREALYLRINWGSDSWNPSKETAIWIFRGVWTARRQWFTNPRGASFKSQLNFNSSVSRWKNEPLARYT